MRHPEPRNPGSGRIGLRIVRKPAHPNRSAVPARAASGDVVPDCVRWKTLHRSYRPNFRKSHGLLTHLPASKVTAPSRAAKKLVGRRKRRKRLPHHGKHTTSFGGAGGFGCASELFHSSLLLCALQQHLHRARRGQCQLRRGLLHPRNLPRLLGDERSRRRLILLHRVQQFQPGIAQRRQIARKRLQLRQQRTPLRQFLKARIVGRPTREFAAQQRRLCRGCP